MDRLLRRNPLIPKMPWLRNALRKQYHSFMNSSSSGLSVLVGGVMEVRLPAEFCSKEIESYEPECVAALNTWIEHNPQGVVIDIGCSFGYLTCAARFKAPTMPVLAIDADAESLAIARKICSLTPNSEKLELLLGLISPEDPNNRDLESTRKQTADTLASPNVKGDPKRMNYVNLDTKIDFEKLPRISLNTIFQEWPVPAESPCIIKCDVEGAEDLVLSGASEALARDNVTLLLSVHPPYLPKFGSSTEQIRNRLETAGFAIEVIGIDHEEHWLCQKPAQ
ncbi:MAG: FkbM family methyltransferase [Verrucomicrobiota bacterium]